jgi:hypothetical protein
VWPTDRYKNFMVKCVFLTIVGDQVMTSRLFFSNIYLRFIRLKVTFFSRIINLPYLIPESFVPRI